MAKLSRPPATPVLRTTSAPAKRGQKNAAVVVMLVGIVAGMGTLVYFSVPLYRLFCEVTGFGGTTQASATTPTTVLDQEITVRFDANIAPDLDRKSTRLNSSH